MESQRFQIFSIAGLTELFHITDEYICPICIIFLNKVEKDIEWKLMTKNSDIKSLRKIKTQLISKIENRLICEKKCRSFYQNMTIAKNVTKSRLRIQLTNKHEIGLKLQKFLISLRQS